MPMKIKIVFFKQVVETLACYFSFPGTAVTMLYKHVPERKKNESLTNLLHETRDTNKHITYKGTIK